jgi:hypothetical protein
MRYQRAYYKRATRPMPNALSQTLGATGAFGVQHTVVVAVQHQHALGIACAVFACDPLGLFPEAVVAYVV